MRSMPNLHNSFEKEKMHAKEGKDLKILLHRICLFVCLFIKVANQMILKSIKKIVTNLLFYSPIQSMSVILYVFFAIFSVLCFFVF